jgi:hypothetical protein
MLQALSEKHNSFLKPLKKKGFKEERVTIIGLYDIGKSHDPGIQQEPPLYKHLLRSSRRNVSPVELIDGPFLMRHKHLAGTLVERREIAQTSSRANGILHHPPEAFDRVEMVATMGRQKVETTFAVVVVKGRVELMRPMDPAPIDDHHHLFAGFAHYPQPLHALVICHYNLEKGGALPV